jgi:uncharacterized protein YaaN involved in tellurite resistance
MDNEQRELKEFLKQLLEHTKEQTHILDEIDEKLHQMKKLVTYVAEHDLTEDEINDMNRTFSNLKREVHILEKQYRGIVH